MIAQYIIASDPLIHLIFSNPFHSTMRNRILIGSQSTMHKDVVTYSSMEHGLLFTDARSGADCSCVEAEHIASLIFVSY